MSVNLRIKAQFVEQRVPHLILPAVYQLEPLAELPWAGNESDQDCWACSVQSASTIPGTEWAFITCHPFPSSPPLVRE